MGGSVLRSGEILSLQLVHKNGAGQLGSPYVIEDIENCAGFICTYGESDILAETAIKILYGEAVPGGKLPVTISEKYPYGHGLTI